MLTTRQINIISVTEKNIDIMKALQIAGWEIVESYCRNGYVAMIRLITEPTLHIYATKEIKAGYEDSPNWKTICKPKHDPFSKLSEHIKSIDQLWREEQERRARSK